MKLKNRFPRLLVVGLVLVLVPVLVLGAPTHAEIGNAEIGIEIDCFSSDAQVTIATPLGEEIIVELSGPTVVRVLIGPNGEADDSNNDGFDEVETEIVSMELVGQSPLGPIVIRTSPVPPSTGEIKELQNNTPGILDIPPFNGTGQADSFFDVFFEIEIGGQVLHNEIPVNMYALIDHKPPLPGTAYQSTHLTPIPLVDEAGQPTGLEMVSETHTVGPPCPVEVGGAVYPVNKLSVLAPWIVLAAAIIGGAAVVVRRHRAQS